MKRLIKYADKYQNGEGKFSNCSTPYEVLPYLVPDDAEESALEFLALELGYDVKESAKAVEDGNSWRRLKVTHNLKIGTLRNGEEEINEYLGFITLPECRVLDPVENLKGKVTSDQFEDLIDSQELSFQDTGVMQDETKILIISDWDAFHGIELLGYGSFNDLLESQGIDESYFDDSVFYCMACGVYDHNDSGYTYNYRIIDHEQIGINCGCAEKAMEDNLESYFNDTDNAIESEVADKLEEKGRLEKLETFIGGMTDGRGGYIFGKSVREGDPSSVLEEYQNKNPETDFVFVHEESGQFQTYFSICKVVS